LDASSSIPIVLTSDPACFEGKQARLETGIGRSAAQDGLPLTGQLDGLVRLVEVAGQVTHAAEDVGAELMVAADSA
jgi:hypothetical protein